MMRWKLRNISYVIVSGIESIIKINVSSRIIQNIKMRNEKKSVRNQTLPYKYIKSFGCRLSLVRSEFLRAC